VTAHAIEAVSVGRRSGAVPVLATAVVLLGLVVLGYPGPVLVVAMLCPVAAAIAVRPQSGLLLLVLFLPFDSLLKLTSLPDWASSWKEALVLFALFCAFLAPRTARASPGRRLPGWVPAMLGWVAIGLASAIWFHDAQALIGVKINYFYILAALVAWRCPLNRRERDWLVTILMIDGILCAVYGIVQQFLGGNALLRMGYVLDTNVVYIGNYLRSFSTFVQPSQFAFFMMVVLLVAIPSALSDTKRLRNKLFLLALPIYVLGLLSAFARGAVLGLAVGALYLGVRRYRALLIVAPLIGLAVVVLLVSGNMAAGTFQDPTSLGERTSGWTENFVQIADHPFGAGVGRSGAASEKALQLGVAGGSFQPDNYYFKTAYELGVLGLWMFVLFLVAVWRCIDVDAGRASPDDVPFLDGVAASILAAFAASFVATYFEIYPMDALFWVLLGIAASMAAEGTLADDGLESGALVKERRAVG